jgi:toxin-antitoxin system PIN domain toxin
MPSLSFPDINVWLALLLADHVHRAQAKQWWDSDESEVIAFVRFTQLGVLRLLTTPAAMNGKPLTMRVAWAAYDRLFADDRVAFLDEPREIERHYRQHTRQNRASPKLWADAWLLACAEEAGGTLITFDQALAARSSRCLLLG